MSLISFRAKAAAKPRRTRATVQRPGIVASALPADRRNSPGLRRLNQPWQARALARYDDVGECWYPAQFYSRSMQRVRFFPAVTDEKGDVQEVDSGPLADLWERVQDPGGGRTELTGSYGHLMFLTGDGYLVASDDQGEEVWEFLSPVELRVRPGGEGYLRLRAPGLTQEELIEASDDDFTPVGNAARVYRLYRRHPAFSYWADSPVRAVLDLYELLKILTLAAGAEGQSRAANRGLLYVPEELSFASPDAQVGEEDITRDTFMEDFIEGLVNAISNPGDASAMSPFVMRGPGLAQTGLGTAVAMADLIKWMPLGPADSYKAVDTWQKVIDRIAFGLDMPSEMVTGTGTVNHWGGWLLDEQGFRQHVAPVCDKFSSDLTAAYLRPAAKDAGLAEWEQVTIGYDPADAVNHPDEIATAQQGWRDGVVSSVFYREAMGATEDDAPSEEDIELLLAVLGKPPLTEDEPVEGETAPQDGGTGADVAEQPPQQLPTADQTRVAAAKILGAAEAHVQRARALAGARLKNRSQGCEPCRETVKAVTASGIAHALGADTVRDIISGHSSEAALVAGAGDELAETLTRFGMTGDWPVQIGRLVEQHALRTLYEREPPPLPAGVATVVLKAVAA